MNKKAYRILLSLIMLALPLAFTACGDEEVNDKDKPGVNKPDNQDPEGEEPDNEDPEDEEPENIDRELLGAWIVPVDNIADSSIAHHWWVDRLCIVFGENSDLKYFYIECSGGANENNEPDKVFTVESDPYTYTVTDKSIEIYNEEGKFISRMKYSIDEYKLELTLKEGKPFPSSNTSQYGDKYTAPDQQTYTKEYPIDIDLTLSGVTIHDGKFYTYKYEKSKIENIGGSCDEVSDITILWEKYYMDDEPLNIDKYFATGTLEPGEHELLVSGYYHYLNLSDLKFSLTYPIVIVESREDLPTEAPEIGTYTLSKQMNPWIN